MNRKPLRVTLTTDPTRKKLRNSRSQLTSLPTCVSVMSTSVFPWRRRPGFKNAIQCAIVLSFVLYIRQIVLLGSQDLVAKNTHDASPPPNSSKLRLLPTPVLVVSMPKTGTSSIHAFFERSGYRSSHHRCINGHYCGLCIRAAIQKGQPPLQSCGNYEVWAQMDIENLGQCHLTQILNLKELHEESPNATFILSHRNMTNWARSVKNWVGGVRSMAARLAKCKGGPKSKSIEDLIEWHWGHIRRIRSFVEEHPSHHLVEIDIENPRAGFLLEQHFGPASPAKNWGHENDSLTRNASRMTSREH